MECEADNSAACTSLIGMLQEHFTSFLWQWDLSRINPHHSVLPSNSNGQRAGEAVLLHQLQLGLTGDSMWEMRGSEPPTLSLGPSVTWLKMLLPSALLLLEIPNLLQGGLSSHFPNREGLWHFEVNCHLI